MAKWKQIGSSDSKFYTYIAPTASMPVIIGPGDRLPTPKEVVDAINKGKIDDLNRVYPSIGIKYDQTLDAHSEEDLPPGAYYYAPASWSRPDGLVPTKIRDDSYTERDVFHIIRKDITDFLDAEEMYGDIGIQFRRGILMYGPPGEGKTVIIRQLAKDIIPDNAFTIFTRSAPSREFLEHLQKVEPNRIKVFIFEELAATLGDPWTSTEAMLDFLDGETSPNKSLIIGTTNYPAMLPRNIIDRPSRFDLLVKVGPPAGKEINRIAKHYLKRDIKQAEMDALNGLSTAAIKEACILSMKSKVTIQSAAKELKARHELVLSGFDHED